MIEKLKKQNTWGECLEKLNEVIDAVNELQARTAILEEHAHPTAKTPVDPFAEQRKWIGKLCRMNPYDWGLVWDYKILERINENNPDLPFVATDGDRYKVCEPVKPDDDIIYKGE